MEIFRDLWIQNAVYNEFAKNIEQCGGMASPASYRRYNFLTVATCFGR